MHFTVDRIEENIVVAESESGIRFELPLALFNENGAVAEGMSFRIERDAAYEDERRARIDNLRSKLFKRD